MNRILELENEITKHRNVYYNPEQTDISPISDQEFDALVEELTALDPNNKILRKVGAPPVSEWKKANHQIPMGSLDKVNTPEELCKWVENTAPGEKLFITEKLDGISIELIYENGALTQCITRGDGVTGEDITSNVMKMKGVQHKLLSSQFSGSVRGEIIMKKSIHQKYFPDKANPRNAASGISKRLDGVGCEHLNVIVYQVLGNTEIELENEEKQDDWLIFNLFDTPLSQVASNAEEVNQYWRHYQDNVRSTLDYDIDGLVVRINDLDTQLSLGEKNLRPKGAIAFKFDNISAESTLLDILWQTGNSGRITPVAVISPVTLVGAKIERASIYNYSYIQELKLDIGSKVLIVRSNDVIPKIIKVVEETGTIALPPDKCPVCHGPVSFVGENLICISHDTCAAQISGRISNWITELNLLEWGSKLIDRLVGMGKVNDVGDLYTLTVDDLANIDRMGKKSAQKCYDILWKNNEIPLEVFLGALSIPMIGQSTIKMVMKEGYDNLDKILSLTVDDLTKIPGLGEIKAQFLVNGLVKNKDLINKILQNGIKIKSKISGPLSNKSVCFTGTMVNKRAVLEGMVIAAGGEVKDSVSKGLSYLVINSLDSTSKKVVNAKKYGTTLISEDEFLKLIS